ncbi:MAG: hypothetical protein SGBAC_006599 [Bacillariaceae sp.]
MGNQQSGGGDGGGRMDGAIGNTLASISEHTFDWNDMLNDDDSIWDEASLAEDVYSLGESSRSDDPAAIELLPSVIPITQKIDKTKHKLLKFRSKTLEKRQEMKAEQKDYKSELKKTDKLLKKMAKKAQSYFGYFEYLKMVKRDYHTKENHNLNTAYYAKQNTASSATTNSTKPMSTALVTQTDAFFFSIFALWEAYLLKKTHIAVMQHSQEKVQKKGWNDVIMNLNHELCGIKEAFDEQEEALKEKIEAANAELSKLRDAKSDMIRCQDKLIRKLQENENWMSGSIANVFSSDEEDSDSDGDSDSTEGSIPLQINTRSDKHRDGHCSVMTEDASIEVSTEQGTAAEDTGGTTASTEDDTEANGTAADDEESLEGGVFELSQEEKRVNSQIIPVQLKDRGLLKKVKEAKVLMNSSMKDLSLEEDDFW